MHEIAIKQSIVRYFKKYWAVDLLTVGLVFAYPIYKHTGISESLIFLVLGLASFGWYVFQILPQERKAAMEVAESKGANEGELEREMSSDVRERFRKFLRPLVHYGVLLLLVFSFYLTVPIYTYTDSTWGALIYLALASIVGYWYMFYFSLRQ